MSTKHVKGNAYTSQYTVDIAYCDRFGTVSLRQQYPIDNIVQDHIKWRPLSIYVYTIQRNNYFFESRIFNTVLEKFCPTQIQNFQKLKGFPIQKIVGLIKLSISKLNH